MEFLDRRDAGRRLASQLAALARENPVVVALPRGGVPVAFEIARALAAPLDILAVRKLGAPANPEFAVGALAEDGTQVVNAAVARRIGMSAQTLAATVEREVAELRRRVERYRDGRAPVDVRGRTVIVVDDGIATGLTDLVAVRALRRRGARRIVVAVPVGPADSVALVGEEADEIVCHTIPRDLIGVGRWYRDFSPVSDEEVLALLARAAAAERGANAEPPAPDQHAADRPAGAGAVEGPHPLRPGTPAAPDERGANGEPPAPDEHAADRPAGAGAVEGPHPLRPGTPAAPDERGANGEPPAPDEHAADRPAGAGAVGGPYPLRPGAPAAPTVSRELALAVDGVVLAGDLRAPANPRGLVIFAHGSGSSRLSSRNRAVAARLGDAGLATVLFDLLTEEEGDRRELVFDVPLLARRLEGVTRWAVADRATRDLPIGYFGASTGAAAALHAAAAARDVVRAVVSRGGRPDLAGDRLPWVRAATLLLVGSRDATVLALNREAAAALECVHQLIVVDGADHLFTQPGALEEVALLAAAWFGKHLSAPELAATGG